MKTIIISGSSRKDGNTSDIANELALNINCEVIHLLDYAISPYDYEHKNISDDFVPLLQKLLSNYDTYIFATPVYWYAMSGILKVFFDRLTDLITIKKELGRQLRRKNMAVVSSSIGDNLGKQFWLPFSKSAEYLGITYLGNTHTIVNQDNTEAITNFIQLFKKQN